MTATDHGHKDCSRAIITASTNTPLMDMLTSDLTAHLQQLMAGLELLNAQHPLPKPSPLLPLLDAVKLLHFKSARVLKSRIQRGTFPPDCCRITPSPTGKRNSYLVNVDRYLKSLR